MQLSTDIRVRRALPSDTPAVLDLTRGVWEGNDYVPYVWRRWLEDPRGLLMVAEMDGVPVGLQHIAIQPDGVAWFEGIRVAEGMRARGVGQAMLEYGIEWAQSLGCPAARLSTASINPSSNRLAEKGGFQPVGRYKPMRGPTNGGAAHPAVRVAGPHELDAIEQYVRASMPVTNGERLYTEGWTAYTLNRDRLRLLLGTSALVVYGRDSIEGLAIATCKQPFNRLDVGLLLGEKDRAVALVQGIMARSAEAGNLRLRAILNVSDDALQSLQDLGFESDQDFFLVLHERRLS